MKTNVINKIIKYTMLGAVALAICASAASVTQAQKTLTGSGSGNTLTGSNNTTQQPSTFIQNPLKAKDINELIVILVDVAVKLGMVISFLALIWVGFQFIMAQGDPGKISDAKTHLFWVVIGIAVLIGAKVIVEIIKGTLEPFVDTSLLRK